MRISARTWLGGLGASVVGLAVACTSSGNPSGGGGGGDDGGGASSGSGSSGGTSSSGSSSGTTSSSGSSSGGTSSSSSSGVAGGDVTLTGTYQANGINSLTVTSSNVCWVDGQGGASSAIKCVPKTGGTVTTVLSDTTLGQDLTTDGTLLYFEWTSLTADGGSDGVFHATSIDSIKVDGTSRTTLVTGFSSDTATHTTKSNELFISGGNFYFGAASSLGNPQLMSAPLTGTSSPAVVVGYPAVGQLTELIYADSAGVYYVEQSLGTTGGGLNFAPNGGGATSSVFTPGTGNSATGDPGALQIAVVNGSAYFLGQGVGTTTNNFFILKAPEPPNGTATAIAAAYTGARGGGIVADANGMYVGQSGGNNSGLFQVDPTTGVETLIEAAPGNGNANPELFALDAQNIYFATSGAVYARPR